MTCEYHTLYEELVQAIHESFARRVLSQSGRPDFDPLVEAHFTGHSDRPAAHRRGNSRPGS